MDEPVGKRTPKLEETDTGPIGFRDEELRLKLGEPFRLPSDPPPFDARDAVDVTIWMKIRHQWDTAMSKTTILGIIQIVMGTLAGILAKAGIAVNAAGALVISAGTGPGLIALTIGFFILGGVKAYLVQDRDGGTGITTWLGILQVFSGTLGTVLLAVGGDVNDATGVVSLDDLSSLPVIILYIIYLLSSAAIAIWAKDREDIGKPKELPA